MKFTVQAETMNLLREALSSGCDRIRFGSEFCEQKIPSLKQLEEAYNEAKKNGKSFSYILPILSNKGIEKIRKQLEFIKICNDIELIVGDLGLINILQKQGDFKIRLGRSRVYIPSRCPWSQITRIPNPSFFEQRKVEKIFYQTNLNYMRSLNFYKNQGIIGADVDWIPKCFKSYDSLSKTGFQLAMHTYGVPVAVTLRCHTARFVDEKNPSLCSRPCLNSAYDLDQVDLKKRFLLLGNVVYRQVEVIKKELKQFKKTRIEELVLPMGALSELNTSKDINEAINILFNEA